MSVKGNLYFCLILLLAFSAMSSVSEAFAKDPKPTPEQYSAEQVYRGFMQWCMQPVMSQLPVALIASKGLVEFAPLDARPFLKYRRGQVFLLPFKPIPATLVIPDDDSCEVQSMNADNAAFWAGFRNLFESGDATFSPETVDVERTGYKTKKVHGFFDNILVSVTASAPLEGASGTYLLAVKPLPKSSVMQNIEN